jgi:hypothetical protein
MSAATTGSTTCSCNSTAGNQHKVLEMLAVQGFDHFDHNASAHPQVGHVNGACALCWHAQAQTLRQETAHEATGLPHSTQHAGHTNKTHLHLSSRVLGLLGGILGVSKLLDHLREAVLGLLGRFLQVQHNTGTIWHSSDTARTKQQYMHYRAWAEATLEQHICMHTADLMAMLVKHAAPQLDQSS